MRMVVNVGGVIGVEGGVVEERMRMVVNVSGVIGVEGGVGEESGGKND